MMFQIGLEFDFSHLAARANRVIVLRVGVACLALPFGIGLALGYYASPVLSPQVDRLHSDLFIATAFCITALPVLGRIMAELQITRTRLGVIAISVAAMNDIVGWLLLALVTALTLSSFDTAHFALRLLMIAAFVLVCIFGLRPLLRRIVRRSQSMDGRMSGNLLGVLLVTIFLSAMTTYELGIFAFFGAFIVGVVLFDEVQLVRAWQDRIGEFVTVFSSQSSLPTRGCELPRMVLTAPRCGAGARSRLRLPRSVNSALPISSRAHRAWTTPRRPYSGS